jgi:hypothetical protein
MINLYVCSQKKGMRRRTPIKLMCTEKAFEKARMDEPMTAIVQIRSRGSSGDHPMYRAELKVLGPLLEPSLSEDAIPLSEITYRSLLARVMDSIGDQITSAEDLNQYMRPRLK